MRRHEQGRDKITMNSKNILPKKSTVVNFYYSKQQTLAFTVHSVESTAVFSLLSVLD